MGKRSLMLILFALGAVGLFAQRSLEVKDITTELNVFSGKDDEAGIVISCATKIPVTMESSHDKVVDIYSMEEKGNDTYYYLRFKTGKKFRGRKLILNAQGYLPLMLSVDLSPKELKQYRVFDPDEEFVYGCYYEYRKRGTDFFKKGLYKEAKQQFMVAKECSDCPENSGLDELMSNSDSIISWQQKADECIVVSDYMGAVMQYRKVLSMNPADESASAKRLEYELRVGSDCKRYFDYAEMYEKNGDLEKAVELYQKVLDMNCFNAHLASEQMKRLRITLNSRKNRASVWAYEYSKSAPIGITTGSYRNKVGGYFSLSLHQDVFKAIQKDYEGTKQPEVNVSFGWTVRPTKAAPVWIFFGPGYTGIAEYVPDEVAEGEEAGDDDYTFKMYHAVSPEIGLLGKIGPLVLRYTFQYRFPIEKKKEEKFTEKTRHVFGIGFCF